MRDAYSKGKNKPKTVVIENLPNMKKNKKKHKDIDKDEFDQLLKALLVEKADILRCLAKK